MAGIADFLKAVRRAFVFGRLNPTLLRDKWIRHAHPFRMIYATQVRKRGPILGPESVQISVSNRCNYRCVFCWDHPSFVSSDTPYPDPDTANYYAAHPEVDYGTKLIEPQLMKELIDDLQGMGTRKVALIGRGEPLLHPELIAFIECLKERGMFVILYSNGSLLTTERVEALVRSALDELNVSFNAGTATTYAKLHPTARPETYDSITAQLQGLAAYQRSTRRKSPSVSLSFVLCRENYREIEAMVHVGIRMAAKALLFDEVIVYERMRFLGLDAACRVELRDSLLRGEQLARDHGVCTNIPTLLDQLGESPRHGTWDFYQRYPCYAGCTFSVVLADGTVNCCCQGQRYLGNLRQTRFRDLWESSEYRAFRAESLAMPATKTMTKGCRCHQCAMVSPNWHFHHALPFLVLPGLRAKLMERYTKG